MTVLVVDDRRAVREHFARIFRAHVVLEAETVLSARRALAHRPELVVLAHDLSSSGRAGTAGVDEGTGYDVAWSISELHPSDRPRRVVLHGCNPSGTQRIAHLLGEAGVEVVIDPYR